VQKASSLRRRRREGLVDDRDDEATSSRTVMMRPLTRDGVEIRARERVEQVSESCRFSPPERLTGGSATTAIGRNSEQSGRTQRHGGFSAPAGRASGRVGSARLPAGLHRPWVQRCTPRSRRFLGIAGVECVCTDEILELRTVSPCEVDSLGIEGCARYGPGGRRRDFAVPFGDPERSWRPGGRCGRGHEVRQRSERLAPLERQAVRPPRTHCSA